MKHLIEIEIPKGATHHDGTLVDGGGGFILAAVPIFYKKTEMVGMDFWWVYNQNTKTWDFFGYYKPCLVRLQSIPPLNRTVTVCFCDTKSNKSKLPYECAVQESYLIALAISALQEVNKAIQAKGGGMGVKVEGWHTAMTAICKLILSRLEKLKEGEQ